MPSLTVLTSTQAIPDASIRWFLLRSSLIEKLREDTFSVIQYGPGLVPQPGYRRRLTAAIQATEVDVYSEYQFENAVETVRRGAWEASDYGEDIYSLEQANELLTTFGIDEVDDDSFKRPTTVKFVTATIRVTLRVENSADASETEDDVSTNLRANDDYVDDSFAFNYDVIEVNAEVE